MRKLDNFVLKVAFDSCFAISLRWSHEFLHLSSKQASVSSRTPKST